MEMRVLLKCFQEVNVFGVYQSAKAKKLHNKVEIIEALINTLLFRPIINIVPTQIKETLFQNEQ